MRRASARKREGNTLLGKQRSSSENKLKLVVEDKEWEGLSDVDGNQDRKKQNDFVKTLMNLYYISIYAQISNANLY